jgi:hypothetical protein
LGAKVALRPSLLGRTVYGRAGLHVGERKNFLLFTALMQKARTHFLGAG